MDANKIASAAKLYLTRRGYDIVDAAVSLPGIDIAAFDGSTLAFVELAARGAAGRGGFPEAVTVRETAESSAIEWLASHRLDGDFSVRFDALSVVQLSDDHGFIRYHTSRFGASEA